MTIVFAAISAFAATRVANAAGKVTIQVPAGFCEAKRSSTSVRRISLAASRWPYFTARLNIDG